MKFRDFLLKEQKEKHAVLAFGRMNPPTTGHEVLVNKVKEVANQVGGSHHVVLSHSQDKNKNPLSAKQKLKHAQRFFPNTNLSVSNASAPNFLEQAKKLHQKGVTHLHMVAGSDRVPEYKQLLQKYNGTHEGALFNFKEIHVHSAGERDPDAEGTTGMSASKMREHAKTGNFKEFKKGIPGHIKNEHAKELFSDVRASMGVREHLEIELPMDNLFEQFITEGVHDKSIFKAVFLAGGPGSGKDYVLDNTLSGHGLTEINSDKALEFLMDKKGLDKTMPASEQEERDVVRGKAKNITELRQRLALMGRNGLIINGTGDDVEKIAKIKERLEEIGYDTHMVAVNTADEVSKQRNIERGTRGGRTVPEEIRKKKWDAVQAARPQFAEMFGQNYSEFDNSEDLRNAPPEVVKAKKDEMLELFKKVKEFTSAAPANPKAQEWIANELHTKDTLAVTDTTAEHPPHSSSEAAQEAQRMGLQYFGFGRYGKDGKVTHHSVNDKLVAITKIKPPEANIPVSSSSGVKNVNEEFEQLDEDLRKWFDKDHPEGGWKRINSKGEAIGPCAREPGEPKPKCMSNEKRAQLSKKERASAVAAKRRHDPNPERKGEPINVSNYGKGKISEATSLEKFRAAAAQRQKEHDQRQKEMETRHAQGKEDMKGAIDRLAKAIGEETLDEVSVNTLQSYKQKATQDAVVRASTGKGKSLDRFLNVQKAQDKINIAKEKEKTQVKQTTMSEGYVKDKNGKVRVFMLRRAAAKEAHQTGGVVHKQGAGYVIKLKENEDVTSINQPIQEETRSSIGISSGGRITEGSCGATQEQSCDCGCGGGKTKITISQAKKKLKEKVSESIDRGIEPGMSMKKPVEELTGDETTLSIGDQKEDELKKQGISLSSFKAKKTV